jgi:hypothetical protein
MVQISPDETLRKYGKWIDRRTWIKLVSRDRNVGERQAWNIIKRESKAKKHVYQDGTTSYGLPEFGPLVAKEEHTTIIQQPKLGFWASLMAGLTGLLASLIGYFERRAERKARQLDRDIIEADAQCAMDRAEMELIEDDPRLFEKIEKIRQKVRRDRGLKP